MKDKLMNQIFRSNNFKKRFLTGFCLATVILLSVHLGPFSFVVLLLTINLLSLKEFYDLLATTGVLPAKKAAYILSVCLIITLLVFVSRLGSWKWLLLSVPITFAIFIITLYRPVAKPFETLGITYLGIICITLPICIWHYHFCL